MDSDKSLVKDRTYEIVSRVAFLIGVPQRIFEYEHATMQLITFQRLSYDKNARIIRNLCIIRTEIVHNFGRIANKIQNEFKTIQSIPEFISSAAINELSEDGIEFSTKKGLKPADYVIEINHHISNRINNCKSLFPLWLCWDYLKNLFIMPNGFSGKGIQDALSLYYENRDFYPFQMYINWNPYDAGNILNSDMRFVLLLYEWNYDEFTELSKVSDVGENVKGNIYDYIASSGQVVIVVDCENSDPYKLSATLKGLDNEYLSKIRCIILFDDVHTASAWALLDHFTNVPVEHITIDRIKQNKSLVDIKLTARACQEYYENHVDSFIMVSSDSDYWGLISSLPKARFLVMIESEKCGPDMKAALSSSGIFYCYLDDFYSGDAEELKTSAIIREMRNYIASSVKLNVNAMLDEALRLTRVQMSSPERKQFYDRYIKSMQLEINNSGDVSLVIKSWKAPH